ncbi:MAG TPA: aldo/keto reductase [Thermoplasmata archaeon]
MQYRRFGSIDFQVSALGFGCMRLPTTDRKPMSKKIDEKRATRMIRHAIDKGVNYVDNAYPYHGGKSEAFLGKALRDGYRDKVRLATKCPVWLMKRPSDFDKYLDQQLKRLRTDTIDFYLFHALHEKAWKNKIVKLKLLDRAERAIDAGKIGHIGFSFHDTYKVFKEIVDGYDGWEFCQIQYNYLDTVNQAGTKGLRYAASKGLGVIIMEPLLGGRLATPPKSVKTMFDSAKLESTPADLALQWLWNQPEVSVVLSGMSTLAQVNGNLVSADSSGVGSMSAKELKLVERMKRRYEALSPIPCTKCAYCMPCPHGVSIPGIFEVYIDGIVNDDLKTARRSYNRFIGEKARASNCKQCRKCEKKCPQKIKISEWMPELHRVLGEGRAPSKAARRR